jgi:mono/diheme cytochrome c family protein
MAGAALWMTAATGCRLEMYDQPKLIPLRGNAFYADSQSARPFIPGTVGHGEDATLIDSVNADATGGSEVMHGIVTDRADQMKLALGEKGTAASSPLPMTKTLLMRGHERFDIYCSPCHGRLGDGKGMIVARGFPAPPSFHEERLRTIADGHFYDVITNGFGKMYSYASRIPSNDRWAIIAYIRALQLSQNATVQDVPPQEQNKLQK